MDRRHFLVALVPATLAPYVAWRGLRAAAFPASEEALAVAAATGDAGTTVALAPDPIRKLKKDRKEWKRLLTDDQYDVLFEEDTERPMSSPLNAEKRAGTFVCAACHLPLFLSSTKFESGTGWPSFTQPIAGHVESKRDFKMIIPRTEYHCARCEGHQGHVFDDGPPPRGERWCNNGVALRFVATGVALPALRT